MNFIAEMMPFDEEPLRPPYVTFWLDVPNIANAGAFETDTQEAFVIDVSDEPPFADDDTQSATQTRELVKLTGDEDTQPYVVLDEVQQTADVDGFFPKWAAFRRRAAARGWVK